MNPKSSIKGGLCKKCGAKIKDKRRTLCDKCGEMNLKPY